MLSALAFLVCFAAIAVLAFARDPIYGLYLYFLTFFIHPPSRWWGSALPDLRWALIAAGVTAAAILLARRKIPVSTGAPWYASVPGMALIVIVVWMVIQSLWAINPSYHEIGTTFYAKYVLTFYFVYRLANTPGRITNVLLVIMAGCLYLGWLAWNAPASAFHQGRLNGVGGPGINDANSLAMMFASGVVIGAVFLMSFKGWRRNAAFFALPLTLNGLILAASRGAFLALVGAGLVMAMLKSKSDRLKFWMLACLAVFALLTLSDLRFIERLYTVSSFSEQADDEREKSAQSRLVIMAAQIRMALVYPHGAGHRGTATLSSRYLDDEWLSGGNAELGIVGSRSSHNTFLTLWVEQGLIGLAVFVVVVSWGIICTLRLRRLFKKDLISPVVGATILAPACCLAAILFAGVFTDYFLAEIQIWMLALLASANAVIMKPLLSGNHELTSPTQVQEPSKRRTLGKKHRHPKVAARIRRAQMPKRGSTISEKSKRSTTDRP